MTGLQSRTYSRQDGYYPHEREYLSHNDIIRFIRRHFIVIAGTFMCCVMAAWVYAYLSEPVYSARAQLLIDPSLAQPANDRTGETTMTLDSAAVEGQLAILRSEAIAIKVVEMLKLNDDVDFITPRPSPLGKVKVVLWRLLGAKPAARLELTDFERTRSAIDTFQSNLDVRRVGVAYAIDISFSSNDPQRAAVIANATADAYLKDQIESKSSAARQGSDWLEGRINQLRKQLNKAERDVQEFRARHDYRIRPAKPDPETLPDAAAAGTSNAASSSTATPSDEDKGESSRGTADDGREAVTLVELRTTAQTYRKLFESYQQAFAAVVQRQSFPVSNARTITPATKPGGKSHPRTGLILAFGGLVGGMLGVGIAFLRHNLDRSVRSAHQLLEYAGLPLLAQFPIMRTGPFQKTGGYRRLLESATRGVASAATAAANGNAGQRSPLSDKLNSSLRHYTVDDEASAFQQVILAPFSRFSAGFRALKTSLAATTAGKRALFSLGVTSSVPKEGKSTVAGNLAFLMASSGLRTLIIDADIHNSTITRHLAPAAATGLLDVLAETGTWQAAILSGGQKGPDILSVGTRTKLDESLKLVTSDALSKLLRELRDVYDIVIVDLPPVDPVVDTLAITPQLDGVLVVTEWGQTPIDHVAATVQSMRRAGAHVIGSVLTKVGDPAAVRVMPSGALYGDFDYQGQINGGAKFRPRQLSGPRSLNHVRQVRSASAKGHPNT